MAYRGEHVERRVSGRRKLAAQRIRVLAAATRRDMISTVKDMQHSRRSSRLTAAQTSLRRMAERVPAGYQLQRPPSSPCRSSFAVKQAFSYHNKLRARRQQGVDDFTIEATLHDQHATLVTSLPVVQ